MRRVLCVGYSVVKIIKKMAEEFSAKNIAKFNGTNFQGWKFQLNTLFIAYGIRDVVVGDRTLPNGEGQERETERWIKDNARAMFLISSSMEYNQLEALIVCTTAKEMWTKLSALHEQKSASNKLMLTQRFHEYRMSSGDSIIQHIAKVQNMAAQLTDLGENVSNTTIIAKVLASLSPKYSTLQTAWDSVDPDRQTLENLTERLIREEVRLTPDDEAPGAFAAYKKGKDKSSGSRKPGKEGQTNKKEKEDRKHNIKCFRCKKRGHYARECQNKRREDTDREDGDDQGARDCAFVAEKSKMALSASVVKSVSNVKKEDLWLTDSGASRHITHRREWFSSYRQIADGGTISLGDNKKCEIVGEGDIYIDKYVNGKWCAARITDVLYVPSIKKNLFSVGVCTSRGLEVVFRDDYVRIENNDEVLAIGLKQTNHIYHMLFRVKDPKTIKEVNISETNLRVWHERLGHVNCRTLKSLVNKGLVKGVKLTGDSEFFCESCQMGKSHRREFKKERVRAKTIPGEVIHTDVCGPMKVRTPGGSRFFLTFKDDATSFRYIYFLQYKSDVYEKFKIFDKLIENKFGRVMRVLRSDNGREFKNATMDKYLDSRGIRREYTAPYTPEQNGKAERDNRTIVESARTMMNAKGLPQTLWAEASNTAVYLMNRAGSGQNNVTPYELWIKAKPNLDHIRIFGSEAYVNIPKQLTTKFDARAKRMLLVGYDGDSSNYRLYDPVSKKVTVSRDVVFNEQVNKVSLPKEIDENGSLLLPKDEPEQEEAEINDVNEDEEVFASADEYEEQNNLVGEDNVSPERPRLRDRQNIKRPIRFEVNVAEYIVPSSYDNAINGEDAEKWIKAIKEELDAHRINGTWKLVERKTGMKTIDSKWVFKVMRDVEGNVHRYKARLCARGFMQRQGLDFNETFAPVVRYDSLRVLLAIAAEEDLELAQSDVKTAFLHGKLKEEVFMEVPEGLKMKNGAGKNVVCRLECHLLATPNAILQNFPCSFFICSHFSQPHISTPYNATDLTSEFIIFILSCILSLPALFITPHAAFAAFCAFPTILSFCFPELPLVENVYPKYLNSLTTSISSPI